MENKTNTITVTSDLGKSITVRARLVVPKISIERKENIKNFIPLGIEGLEGTAENKTIPFDIKIEDGYIESFDIQIIKDGNILSTYSEVLCENDINLAKKNKKGEYSYSWDGFDDNYKFDSTVLTSGELKAKIIGHQGKLEYTAESKPFKLKAEKVDWLDVKIDLNIKRIDVLLRINVWDGGAEGLGKKHIPGSRPTPHAWDRIPPSKLQPNHPIIKYNRTKSFSDLEQLVLQGIEEHWSRNPNRLPGSVSTIGDSIAIDTDKFEVYSKAINTTEKCLDDVKLIYRTNLSPGRSSNPSRATGNPLSWAANVVPQRIFYNVGYLHFDSGWGWRTHNNADIIFKDTAAHEIGHDILNSIGGSHYSITHKGTSTLWQSSVDGNHLPSIGEIDLMKYYSTQRNSL